MCNPSLNSFPMCRLFFFIFSHELHTQQSSFAWYDVCYPCLIALFKIFEIFHNIFSLSRTRKVHRKLYTQHSFLFVIVVVVVIPSCSMECLSVFSELASDTDRKTLQKKRNENKYADVEIGLEIVTTSTYDAL